MKVTGLVADGARLREERRDLPAPQGTQVLVGLEVAGICGSDLKMLHAAATTLRREAGLFAGHEGAGIVLAAGPQARLAAGDRVLVYSYEGCQTCAQCLGGEPKFCPQARATTVGRDGTWATHFLVEQASCVPLPGDLDLFDAAVLACTGGTAAAAVLKAGPIAHGMPALVFGAGPLGCAVAQLLTGLGATVHAADPNAGRVAFARERGWVAGVAGQDTYPLVVETSGSQPGRAAAVTRAASGGRVVFAGLGATESTVDIDATIRRELTLTGSHFWRLNDFGRITELYRAANAKPADLVTGRYSLANAQQACHDAATATGKLVLLTGEGEG